MKLMRGFCICRLPPLPPCVLNEKRKKKYKQYQRLAKKNNKTGRQKTNIYRSVSDLFHAGFPIVYSNLPFLHLFPPFQKTHSYTFHTSTLLYYYCYY